MGGELTVSSELGRCSVFRFQVEVTLADVSEVQGEQSRRRVIGREPGQPDYRMLVVEDREANRKLMVKLLRPLGFEVREAVNGEEGIRLWEEWSPHLIWMDMRMPVMDGHEATRRIKATTKGQATVIIALTASAFEEDRKLILSAGCDDFIRKPFREHEIFDMLTKHLGVRFLYQDEVQPASGQSIEDHDGVLTPAALAALPAAWVAQLREAAIQADGEQVLHLVDQIRTENEALGQALADLAYNFRYDLLLALTQQDG
jgi:CheY-like chemotaxis protein